MKRVWVLFIVAALSSCGSAANVGQQKNSSAQETDGPAVALLSVRDGDVVNSSPVIDGTVTDVSGVKKVKIHFSARAGLIQGEAAATYHGNEFSATLPLQKDLDYSIWVEAEDTINNVSVTPKIRIHSVK